MANPTATNARGSNTHSYPAYDYPVAIGTGLVAPKSGVITDLPGVSTRKLISPLKNWQAWPQAGGGSPNSGNVLVIKHSDTEYTAYLHVTPYDVAAFRGKRVSQGQIFHKSGHNGWSTGPHLHFEVWKNGTRVDPGVWLANIKEEGVTNEQKLLLLYDDTFYKNTYPDLAKNGVDTADERKAHWLRSGVKAGRRPSKGYDPKAYRANNSDLNRLYGDNWAKYALHYVNHGIKEGRRGN